METVLPVGLVTGGRHGPTEVNEVVKAPFSEIAPPAAEVPKKSKEYEKIYDHFPEQLE